MERTRKLATPVDLEENVLRLGGSEGRRWLDAIPDIVEELSATWRLKEIRTFPRQSFNLTASCKIEDGRRAVLKVGFPSQEHVIRTQARLLEHFGGGFCAELYRFDERRNAILMEALDPGLTLCEEFRDDPDAAVEIGLSILLSMPRAIPEDLDLPALSEWFEVLEAETSSIVPDEVLKTAGKASRELLDDEEVLLHGDFHHGNILTSGTGEYKVIDPECVTGPVAYDASVFLNEHYRWMLGRNDTEERQNAAVERVADVLQMGVGNVCRWGLCQIVQCMCWDAEDFGRFEDHDLEVARRWLRRVERT